MPDSRLASPSELKERLEAERLGVSFLLYRDDAQRQRIETLDGSVRAVTLGRGSAAQVRLDWDSEVSRVHAEIARVGDEWAVEDQGLSRNGTFVNGEPLRGRRRLRDGDRVRVGETELLFRAAHVGETRQTSVASGAHPQVALTDQQRRVLAALCRPLSEGNGRLPATNRQIADEVFLSVDAVKKHLRVLCDKFAVGGLPQNAKRVRLAELALRSSPLSPDAPDEA